jgi:hypothetical protein
VLVRIFRHRFKGDIPHPNNARILIVGLQVLDELNPPMKVLGRFLRTWGDCEKTKAKYSSASSIPLSADGRNSADISLSLSRRLIDVVKFKNILNIEAGMEMIALGMVISSEVRIKDISVITLIYFLSIRTVGSSRKWLGTSNTSYRGLALYYNFSAVS